MHALHHQVGSGCRKPQDPVRARVGKGAVPGPWASRRPVTTGSGSWASQGTVEELRSGGPGGSSVSPGAKGRRGGEKRGCPVISARARVLGQVLRLETLKGLPAGD